MTPLSDGGWRPLNTPLKIKNSLGNSGINVMAFFLYIAGIFHFNKILYFAIDAHSRKIKRKILVKIGFDHHTKIKSYRRKPSNFHPVFYFEIWARISDTSIGHLKVRYVAKTQLLIFSDGGAMVLLLPCLGRGHKYQSSELMRGVHNVGREGVKYSYILIYCRVIELCTREDWCR